MRSIIAVVHDAVRDLAKNVGYLVKKVRESYVKGMSNKDQADVVSFMLDAYALTRPTLNG